MTSLGGGQLELAGADGLREVPVERVDVLDVLGPVSWRRQRAPRTPSCAPGAFRAIRPMPRHFSECTSTGYKQALAGLRQAGVRRVVLTSTSGTLAVSRDPARIDDEVSGSALEFISSWPYYRTKYFAEQLALEHSRPDFEIVVINPSLLLGPGDLRESSTADVRRFVEGAFAVTPRGGLALVDVRDAAEGAVLAAEKGRAGERYI